MKSLGGYLDEVKRLKDITTDTDLAKLLKVSRQHISRVRAGDYMGEEKCFELAEILDKDPLEIISLNWAIRARNNKIREFWLGVHGDVTRARGGVREGSSAADG